MGYLALGLAVLTFMTGALAPKGDILPTPLKSEVKTEQDSDRLRWFRDARFGMFIHWGLYAVPAGEWDGKTDYGEWIMLQAKIPSAEYEKLAGRFNPVRFSAKEWIRTAKEAGMKYIVITAKHHDGFAMYDTKLTDYNIVKATPFKRDPLKELAGACRQEGITLCFYYSVPDWHHPDFPAKYSQRGFHGNPNPHADLDRYVTYMKAQVRELLTDYGPVGILWFDGGGSFRDVDNRAELVHAQQIIDMIRGLQPNCLVNNRLGLPADYGTPEQKIPGRAPDTPFEVCMTLNRHWGFNAKDQDWKSPKEVIRNLVDIVSKGGNYLLNVGPTAEGVIPAESVRILKGVGRWLERNGEAVYQTTASPLPSVPAWGRVTQKGRKVYLHVFDWPADGKLVVEGLKPNVQRAYLLADKERKPLHLQRTTGGVQIDIPANPPDPVGAVVVLESQ
jgi:alpha-L-fucosidase